MNRYSRQIRFTPIGTAGQDKLGSSRVAVVGVGALGSVIASQLVRSGVGYMRLIDRDFVELSNLQRQMLYTESDAAELKPKAEAAAAHLRSMNSSVTIEALVTDITAANADHCLSDVDLIVDGSDNFAVRYLVNDYSIKNGIPWIYGGAVGASGMTMTIIPGETPCYRCLFDSAPAPGTTDSCETAGVIAPIVNIVASVQATEAIKLLSGNQQALHRTLFQIDLWNHSWLPLAISDNKRSSCPACGEKRFDYLEQLQHGSAAALCGRNSVQLTPDKSAQLNLEKLAIRLNDLGTIQLNRYLLKLELPEQLAIVIFPDGRAIIQGTDSLSKARSIYDKIFG